MRFFTCRYRSFILASAKPEPQVVRIYERVSIHTYTHIQFLVVGVRGGEISKLLLRLERSLAKRSSAAPVLVKTGPHGADASTSTFHRAVFGVKGATSTFRRAVFGVTCATSTFHQAVFGVKGATSTFHQAVFCVNGATSTFHRAVFGMKGATSTFHRTVLGVKVPPLPFTGRFSA